jgi:putative transposase
MKLKAYKFRIYPNKAQEVLLNKTFGCVRFAWNQNVAQFNTYDKETNPNLEFKTSTELRNEIEWMQEVSAASIQQKEMDFKEFKKQYFSKLSKNIIQELKTKYINKCKNQGKEIDFSKLNNIGKPNFKKKSNNQSYRLPNQKFKLVKGKLQLEKIGKVKIVLDRDFPEFFKFLNVTVSKNCSGEYYASILIEQEINHKPKTNKECGIDVGIKHFLTQSDGIEVDNPKYFSKNQAKLKRLQQHFSRKQKGSKRGDKCRVKIAKLYQKITNQRDWFLHNYSTYLIENYDRIFIEDLDVKGLLEKKQLSKEISDVSWSKFFQMLQYKADWYGKEIHKVNRFYASSKTCSCGVKNENLKLSDRVWNCSSCGTENSRDHLASKNILKEGRRSLGEL